MLQTIGWLNYNKKHMSNPCGHYITDFEFLKHMIPHHQVAIDMSKRILKYTRNPNIILLARNIIFGQSDEILFMENLLFSSIPDLSSKDSHQTIIIPNQFTVHYPKSSRADNYQCGLHHFSSSVAMKHNNHHSRFTDAQYLDHMIYHHDVAIEMSNRVTKYSTNPSLVSFAYDIIKGQRYEIWLMKQLLYSSQQQFSSIL